MIIISIFFTFVFKDPGTVGIKFFSSKGMSSDWGGDGVHW